MDCCGSLYGRCMVFLWCLGRLERRRGWCAKSGEREFQRCASGLSTGEPDGRRVEQNGQVEQFFECSTGLKPSNHAGFRGLSEAVKQFLRKGQSRKILTAQSPFTFFSPPSSSFSLFSSTLLYFLLQTLIDKGIERSRGKSRAVEQKRAARYPVEEKSRTPVSRRPAHGLQTVRPHSSRRSLPRFSNLSGGTHQQGEPLVLPQEAPTRARSAAPASLDCALVGVFTLSR